MFIHWLAGSLVFLFFGQLFGWLKNPLTPEFDPMFVFFGGFFGAIADFISFAIYEPKDGQNEEKFNYLHRDNLSPSLLLPPVAFFTVAIVVYLSLLLDIGHRSALTEAWHWAVLVLAATLTHPLCDLFGAGWGVQLFYPFSLTSYKLFDENKLLIKWTPKQILQIVRKQERDEWLKTVFFSINWRHPYFWWGAVVEYPSAAIFFYLVVSRI